MRKIALILTTLALLLIGALPLAAQDETIVDIASGNEDLSLLVQALQAADLVDVLNSEGPFTVFAPTNQAFLALVAEMGVDPATVMADPDALTGILLYHVANGELTSDTLEDGAEIVTLAGETIAVSVGDSVVLNDSATVTTADIAASNGIVHVIDAVLVPASFLEMQEAATPETTEEAPAEEAVVEATPVEIPEQFTGQSFVRIAHLAGDVGGADIYIDGVLRRALTDYAYGSVTGFFAIPNGPHTIQVVPNGRPVARAVVDEEITFEDGAHYTVVAYGNAFSTGVEAAVLMDDRDPAVSEGAARVSVFHGIPDAPAVDVVTSDGTLVAGRIAYPGTLTLANGGTNDGEFSFDVVAGTYDLAVVPNGQGGPVLIDLSGTELAGGTYYFVAAYGTADDPMVVVSSSN
ncbi:MAG: fasciclin domain-containing protein [Anaerolineae bacterium]|nr:fasciclin domain-containing protein [Anaerolineae bacterium]MCA9894724.1 fasciclin domain-containing protein [Anaerolineae bacterium]